MLKLLFVLFFHKSSQSKQTGSIRYFALTRTDRLQDFLLHIHLVVMADADTAIYLVEQGRTEVGELTGGDERFGIQTVVGEELSQVQTLEGEGQGTV